MRHASHLDCDFVLHFPFSTNNVFMCSGITVATSKYLPHLYAVPTAASSMASVQLMYIYTYIRIYMQFYKAFVSAISIYGEYCCLHARCKSKSVLNVKSARKGGMQLLVYNII